LLGVSLSPLAAQEPFFLRRDDRIVFYGDSITEQGRYIAYVETYLATRFPDFNIGCINAGWAGDWVVGGGGGKVDQRLARDVVANHPTVAVFMLGMNDAGYQDYDPALFNVYADGYRHLLDSLRQSLPELRISLLEPSPYDEVTRAPIYALHDGGYNKVIVRYGEFVRELGRQRRLNVIDMNAPLVAVLEKARRTNPALAEKVIPDRIHPAAPGGLVMASAILKSWNAPGLVSAVTLDLSHDRVHVREMENARLTQVRAMPSLSWIELDNALPMPFDPADGVLALVLQSSDIVESLDQQRLTIAGLPASRYQMKIDGQVVHSWTRDELARGVSLSLLDTPMLEQSLRVYALSARRHSLRMARWQGVQVALQNEDSPHVSEAIAALDALDNDLLRQQKSAAVPKAHHYELIPESSP
jgi:lysophospholipase L1-like esterase